MKESKTLFWQLNVKCDVSRKEICLNPVNPPGSGAGSGLLAVDRMKVEP